MKVYIGNSNNKNIVYDRKFYEEAGKRMAEEEDRKLRERLVLARKN